MGDLYLAVYSIIAILVMLINFHHNEHPVRSIAEGVFWLPLLLVVTVVTLAAMLFRARAS